MMHSGMKSSLYKNIPPIEIRGPESTEKYPNELELRKYEEAIYVLNNKISDDPNNAALYLERAILRDFNWSHELDIAIDLFNAAEDDLNVYLKVKRQRAKWIYEDFCMAVKLEPDNDLYHFHKGLSHDGYGYIEYGGMTPEEAEIDFSNAIKLNSNDFRYFYARADAIYLQEGAFRDVEVINDLETAISMNPPKNVLEMLITSKEFIESPYK